MATIGKNLERLATLLASGMSVKKASKKMRIGERTAYRWSIDPECLKLVTQLRRKMTDQTIGRLVRSSIKAMSTLDTALGNQRHGVAAAKVILDNMHRMSVAADIDARIAELEQRLKEKNQ